MHKLLLASMALSAVTPRVVVPTTLAPASLSPMAAAPATQLPSLTMSPVFRPLISAPASALQPATVKEIVAPLISAAQGETNVDQLFDASSSREEAALAAAASQDEALRAKVEAELAPALSNAGYLGFSIMPGEPAHHNPLMRVQHVLVHWKHPRYDANLDVPTRAAGMPVLNDYASMEDVLTMTATLAKPSPKPASAALRAKVEADIAIVLSNPGYRGYSIDPSVPGHPNRDMRVRHVIIHMRNYRDVTDREAVIYRAAGMPVMYDYVENDDDVVMMRATLR